MIHHFKSNSYAPCKTHVELLVKRVLTLVLVSLSVGLFAQNKTTDNASVSNDALIDQYVSSKGQEIIVFDSSNIKQFWIDKSVYSKDNNINISLNKNKEKSFESIPLAIQLANVNETLDCTIEVIIESPDIDFHVFNKSSKAIATSTRKDKFLQYGITSSSFHLEDTTNSSFSIVFKSPKTDILSIKRIILSFSKNEKSSFSSPPQKDFFTPDSIVAWDNAQSKPKIESNPNNKAYSVLGKFTVISSKEAFPLLNNKLISSVKIKNIGNEEASIKLGYEFLDQDKKKIDSRNYPFNGTTKILSVVSSSTDSNIITVDKYDNWAKGCYIGLDAKDDMSDIPSTSRLAEKILEIKEKEDGSAEIVLDKPLKNALAKGTRIRVLGWVSNYIYPDQKKLRPGEEYEFNAIISKDNTSYQYSNKAFTKGVYYFRPIIISYSSDGTKENIILINNFVCTH